MKITISRRSFIQSLTGLVIAMSLMTVPAKADDSEALEFVQQLVSETLEAAQSQAGLKENADLASQNDALRGILRKGFAVPQIGKAAVGKNFWRAADKDSQAQFLGAFEDYILRTYASRLKNFAGDVTFLGADASKKLVVVKSQVTLPGIEDAIGVDWKVVNSPIGLKVYDMQIEGTSMLKTFRSEFGAVLKKNRGDLNKLTEELSTKIVGS